jgi:hypothetical protein
VDIINHILITSISVSIPIKNSKQSHKPLQKSRPKHPVVPVMVAPQLSDVVGAVTVAEHSSVISVKVGVSD